MIWLLARNATRFTAPKACLTARAHIANAAGLS
jgi:hypothetical protein